jgi:tetratricopeptide (TPR) repeat protein
MPAHSSFAFRSLLTAAGFTALACCTGAIGAVDPAPLAAARALFDTTGKSAEAQAAFEKIAAADPKNADAQNYLAQLALRRGDADKALAHAEKAAELAPTDADIQNTLGDCAGSAAQNASIFRQPGLAKKCVTAYQRAVALAPENVGYHEDLLQFYRQAPGIVGGGMDKALAEAAVIKKLDPLRGRLAFAGIYAAEKKYELAFAEFDEVLKVSPDDYAALYQVGKLAAMSGQNLDRGLAALRRTLELPVPTAPNTPPRAAAHWRLGNILEKKNDAAGARAAYEAALQLDPQFTSAADALKKLP